MRAVRRPLLEQYAWYIRSRSPAKSAASSPPAPGRISMRHGNWAKGCVGVKLDFNASSAFSILSCVDPTSSSASSFSSWSVDLSSNNNSCSEAFALSYSLIAEAVGESSPSRFAARASKSLASFWESAVCSEASERALDSRAGEMLPLVAAVVQKLACRT